MSPGSVLLAALFSLLTVISVKGGHGVTAGVFMAMTMVSLNSVDAPIPLSTVAWIVFFGAVVAALRSKLGGDAAARFAAIGGLPYFFGNVVRVTGSRCGLMSREGSESWDGAFSWTTGRTESLLVSIALAAILIRHK